jgi:hypothetical protein
MDGFLIVTVNIMMKRYRVRFSERGLLLLGLVWEWSRR